MFLGLADGPLLQVPYQVRLLPFCIKPGQNDAPRVLFRGIFRAEFSEIRKVPQPAAPPQGRVWSRSSSSSLIR